MLHDDHYGSATEVAEFCPATFALVNIFPPTATKALIAKRHQTTSEPILITTNGTILAGFGRWRAAVFNPFGEGSQLQKR